MMNRATWSLVAFFAASASSPGIAGQTDDEARMAAEEARVQEMYTALEATRADAEMEVMRVGEAVMRLAQAEVDGDDEALQLAIEQAQERLEAAAMEIAELTSRVAPEAMRIVRDIRIADDNRAVIGINISSSSEDAGEVDGVRVVGITPGGPASEAGLETGDLIVSLNGVDLAADSNDAANEKLGGLMNDVEPGDPLEILYKRGDRQFEVEFEAGEIDRHAWAFAPKDGSGGFSFNVPNFDVHLDGDADAPYVFAISRHSALGDMELTEITEGLGKYFGTDTGLLVVKAPDDERIPLEDGDVIHKIGDRVPDSPRHAMRILRSYEPGETLAIEVIRDKKRRQLSFEFPERNDKSGRG